MAPGTGLGLQDIGNAKDTAEAAGCSGLFIYAQMQVVVKFFFVFVDILTFHFSVFSWKFWALNGLKSSGRLVGKNPPSGAPQNCRGAEL